MKYLIEMMVPEDTKDRGWTTVKEGNGLRELEQSLAALKRSAKGAVYVLRERMPLEISTQKRNRSRPRKNHSEVA